MANHFRVALYDLTSGTVEEAVEIARGGMLPIFRAHPGFVRYELGKLDDGSVMSFTIWETAAEAEQASALAADWVKNNLADRIALRELHTGDLELDEDA